MTPASLFPWRAIFVACLALVSAAPALASIRVALASDDPYNRADSLPAIRQMLISKGYSVDIVYSSQIATLAQINAYDAVCVGDSGYGQNNWNSYGGILKSYVQGGGGVVLSGWVPGFLTSSGPGYSALSDLLPVGTGWDNYYQQTFVVSAVHPVTAGVGTWTTRSYTNTGTTVKPGATVVGTVAGRAAAVVWDYSQGRVAHLASNYFVSSNAYLHQAQYDGSIPSAQRLLLNAIDWVAGATGAPADTTAPVLTVPANLVLEAAGPAGALATYAATALDDTDGAIAVTLTPASGSTFGLGTTTVTATATDAAGNPATKTFTVTVRDTVAPVLSPLANVIIEATSAAGATATFAGSASDLVSGAVTVSFSPASGAGFPIGTSNVTATATDSAGNTATKTFAVLVRDTLAPVLTTPPSQSLEATGPAGAIATFAATATDAVGATVTYSRASGSLFPLGVTTVTVTATDAAGNAASGSFTITVRDTTAPVIASLPGLVLEATSAAGATATFSPTAVDQVSGAVLVSATPASGSTFALGTTTVGLIATDAAGNTGISSFSVKVVDTTAPVLTLPPSQILEATSAAGAVANFAVSASDAVGATITASAASGSTFSLGTTVVLVTARDAAGNATSGSFTITVRDTTAPVFSSLSASSTSLWPANHKLVAISLTATASDAVGAVTTRIVSVTSNEPDNGLGDGDTAGDIQITGPLTLNLRAERSGTGNGRTYTITVEAKDAANNTTLKTVSVFVPKNQNGK